MSERWGDSQRDRDELDRHITGNYGEDQFADEVEPGMYATADGYAGIAFYVDDYETAPDEDTVWTGIEEPTGKLVAHMVGDDRKFTFEPEELTPLNPEDFCPECGQLGCGHYREDN